METNSITGRLGRLDISYDRDADVLYIAIDKPRIADTFDTERGVLLRRDPQTQEVVGATILHYRSLFKKLLNRSWLKELNLAKRLGKPPSESPLIMITPLCRRARCFPPDAKASPAWI